MAHFAQLDENGIVQNVIVVNNEALLNKEFPDSEPIGVAFCKTLYGDDTVWLQTSYSGSFRHCFAGIGYRFDPSVEPFGAFLAPPPDSEAP